MNQKKKKKNMLVSDIDFLSQLCYSDRSYEFTFDKF